MDHQDKRKMMLPDLQDTAPTPSFTNIIKFDIVGKFKILKRFVKKDDLDNQLAGMSVVDGINMTGASVVSCLESNRDALVAKYSWNYDRLIVGQIDGHLRIFDSHTLKYLAEITDADVSLKSPITGIGVRPICKDYAGGPNIICTYANGFVKNWNSESKECNYTINESRQVLNITYHPRSTKFFTIGDDSKILMYDEKSKTLERIFKGSDPNEVNGHSSKIFSICFNPVSNYEFITGGWDDVICIWDIRQPVAARHLSGPHICGDGLDISPDGNEILSCAWQPEKQINIWDYNTGKVLRTTDDIDGDPCRLYCGKFISPKFIGSGGTLPNTFKVYYTNTLSTAASMTGFNGPIYSMDIGDPKKKRVEKVKSSLLEVPRILISAGKRVYQVEFL